MPGSRLMPCSRLIELRFGDFFMRPEDGVDDVVSGALSPSTSRAARDNVTLLSQ